MNRVASKFPPFFSWVIEDLLAALAFPSQPGHLRYLEENGIKYLVSLTAERLPQVKEFPAISLMPIKIVDFEPPTVPQVDHFIHIVNDAKKNKEMVAVHCAHGKGRTGTMIACYFVTAQGLSAQEAIDKIRVLRPGSIETHQQEALVQQYETIVKSKQG